MSLFKNKFFIITLIIVCALTISAMVLSLLGRSFIVAEAADAVVYPFSRFAGLVAGSARGYVSYFSEYNRLKEENAQLKAELDDIRFEADESRRVKEENDMLYDYLDLKREHMDYQYIAAQILSRSPGTMLEQYTINRGTFHGVKLHSPVVSGGAAVGYISEVGMFTSKVTLLTGASVSVGATAVRTGETGVTEGDFMLGRDGLCRLIYLDKDSQVEPGDQIVTSGGGGIFPEGLRIGEVTEMEPDPLTQTMTAIIKPTAELASLKSVMIINDFERKFE